MKSNLKNNKNIEPSVVKVTKDINTGEKSVDVNINVNIDIPPTPMPSAFIGEIKDDSKKSWISAVLGWIAEIVRFFLWNRIPIITVALLVTGGAVYFSVNSGNDSDILASYAGMSTAEKQEFTSMPPLPFVRGSHHDDILTLGIILHQEGYRKGRATRTFDEEMYNNIIAIEEANGWRVTGEIDEQMYRDIMSRSLPSSAMLLAPTGTPSVLDTQKPTDTSASAMMPIALRDEQMERYLRHVLHKPAGDISAADLETMQEFLYPYQDMDSLYSDQPIEGCYKGGIQDYSVLQFCKNLRRLAIYSAPIENLSFIENCQSLSSIEIETCHSLADVSALSGKTSLTRFSVHHANRLTDASPVLSLPNLQSFVCYDTGITDISPLTNTRNLTEFYADKSISDYLPLLSHKNMRMLYVDNIDRENLSVMLATFKNLSFLRINDSMITDKDLVSFQWPSQMDSLEIFGCPINRLDFLLAIPNVTQLGIDSDLLADLSGVKHLKSLRWINFNNFSGHIASLDLTPLSQFSQTLKYLHINGYENIPSDRLAELKRMLPNTDIL